jgi:hypothetical protein
VKTAFLALIPLGLTAQDAREIVRRSVELDQKNIAIARNYTFLERREEIDLDGAGRVKTREILTYDVTLLEGSPYRRLVARNDRPLSPDEQREEEDKLQKSIGQRRRETPEQRQKRIAEWQRRQERQREPLRELPDAFNFLLAGEETIGGAATYVIDATPKPGYKPRSARGGWLNKLKARLWIDKRDYQWVKADVETLDTISFGAFLVRLAKGGRLTFEQSKVNGEVWLPKRMSLDATAKLLMVKGYHKRLEIRFSDHRKFQVESRVVSTAER